VRAVPGRPNNTSVPVSFARHGRCQSQSFPRKLALSLPKSGNPARQLRICEGQGVDSRLRGDDGWMGSGGPMGSASIGEAAPSCPAASPPRKGSVLNVCWSGARDYTKGLGSER
jgi:hypothetical protein